MIINPKTSTDSFNQPLYGLHGVFALSAEAHLPFFSAIVPIDRAIDELQVAEEIQPDIENRWGLTELFQREVNIDRVGAELVEGYLNVSNKLKFFNALTVVLMPREVATGRLSPHFQPLQSTPPPIPWSSMAGDDKAWGQAEGRQDILIEGLQYSTVGSQARLRWDPTHIHAVVVDGQHRLVALRQFRGKDKGSSFTAEQKTTCIPVLFVLLVEKAGFRHSADYESASISSVARELFTDLNKNAKPVDRARELILDDWSLVARCVRTLVTNTTATDTASQLPLSLVRWQEPNNRFDTSYYLNSLIHLDTALISLLELPSITNPLDKKQADSYMTACRALFNERQDFFDGKWNLETAYKQLFLDEDENPISPFTRLPNSFLELAVRGFEKHHKPWIIRLLTEFRPYANVLSYARANNLIEGTFAKWHAQTRRHRDDIRKSHIKSGDEQWAEREIESHVRAIEQLKGIDHDSPRSTGRLDWSFKAIFQKALLRLAKLVCFENRNTDEHLGSLDDILAIFNALHKEGRFFFLGSKIQGGEPYEAFWTFIALNPQSGTIKVSKKVEDNIMATLRLCYYANRKRRLDCDNGAEPLSAARLLQFFEAGSNTVHWPDCNDAVSQLRASYDNRTLHGADPDTMDQDARKRNLRQRMAAILDAMLLA